MTTIDEQLARLVRNYREPLDEIDVAEYRRALAGVPAALLETVFDHVIDHCRYRPNAAEFRQSIEAVRAAQPAAARAFEPCDKCSENPGWIQVMTSQPPIRVLRDGAYVVEQQPPVIALARCDCFLAWSNTARRPTALDSNQDADLGVTKVASVGSSSAKVRRFQARVSGGARSK